ncbi:MAG: hypothetical protein FWE67_08480 [Planctomycetaceae bacterium]|nr:hypothetical protein [Planctomycetaceae bacterium]
MSGHEIKTSEEQARFCGVDAKPDNLLTTTIPINDIFEAAGKSNATFKLMIIVKHQRLAFAENSRYNEISTSIRVNFDVIIHNVSVSPFQTPRRYHHSASNFLRNGCPYRDAEAAKS